jgi:hypothetical protein
MKLEEEKIRALKLTWVVYVSIRSKEIRAALTAIFGSS